MELNSGRPLQGLLLRSVLLCLLVIVANSVGIEAVYVRHKRQAGNTNRGVNLITTSGIDLSGAFSLEQELGVKYSIGMLPKDGEPLTDSESKNGEIIRLRMENGTQFDCRLVDDEQKETEVDVDPETIIQEARKVLDASPEWCTYRIEGWWTYEVCYNKKVRQYHVDEKNGNAVASDFLLGRYSDPLGNLSIKNDKNASIWNSIDSGDFYVADICEEGDVCDLEEVGGPLGMKRTVEVRYYCGTSARPMLVDVKEPQSCHYIFDVRMSSLCSVPGLSSKVKVPLRQFECKQS